jgi:hypothetical protein
MATFDSTTWFATLHGWLGRGVAEVILSVRPPGWKPWLRTQVSSGSLGRHPDTSYHPVHTVTAAMPGGSVEASTTPAPPTGNAGLHVES